jgi:hypothetical protein
MNQRNIKRNKLSVEAIERIRNAKGRGRPATYPEIAILAQRAKVSRTHAYFVVTGKRKSAPLEAMLVGIRAELAALKVGVVA